MDAKVLSEIVEILKQASQPRTIILFGSQSTGSAQADSDIDLLVIETTVQNRMQEMVRLLRLLSPLRLPLDVLVIQEDDFLRRSQVSGNVYYEASRTGKVLYDYAA